MITRCRNRFSSLRFTISQRPRYRHPSSDAIVIPDILNIDNDGGNGAANGKPCLLKSALNVASGPFMLESTVENCHCY